jgi:flagellar hook protein FlgE
LTGPQGAITTSTERTHLAIQGTGFFILNDLVAGAPSDLFTRGGEFTSDKQGYLRHS